jgi:hypothetical protein
MERKRRRRRQCPALFTTTTVDRNQFHTTPGQEKRTRRETHVGRVCRVAVKLPSHLYRPFAEQT